MFARKQWSGHEVNRLFCNVSRIVLDPRYRGAGIAGDFLRAVVLQAPTRYVELVTSMGTMTRFWERAGFQDYGPIEQKRNLTKGQGVKFGRDAKRPGEATAQSRAQSMTSTMRYFLADTDKFER